jgi:acetoin:2,6-dichlorophenolindophenol oxidoreductase subunit alpha
MPVKAAAGSLISDGKLKELYASMLRSRLVAEHGRRLRTRRALAFYRTSMGQEAIVTGCVIDLRAEDTVVDTVGLVNPVKGLPQQAFQLAIDAALADKEKSTNVVVVFSSSAATTRVSLRRAVKFASARSLSVIFVVENNSLAGERSNLKMQQTGLTSITVDGNDVVAVYRVAYESLERVRQGGGPVLIEGKTYRQDGQGPVRSERDPVAHMEQYLAAKGLFTQRWKDQLVKRFTRELDAATRYLRASSAVTND